MQSDAKRSRGPDLPAICDLQGNLQKLQGEPILLLPSFLMVSRSWKEFSRTQGAGSIFGIAGKGAGRIFGIAGKSSVWNCECWQSLAPAGKQSRTPGEIAGLGICNQQIVTAARKR